MEAFRSGKTIDRLFVLDGCQDGPVRTIVREAKKHDTIVNFVPKERLDSMSETGHHQGVMADAISRNTLRHAAHFSETKSMDSREN